MRALLGVVAVCGLGCVGSQVQVLTSLTPVDASRPHFILEAQKGDACGPDAVVRAVENLFRIKADGFVSAVIEQKPDGCVIVTAHPVVYGCTLKEPRKFAEYPRHVVPSGEACPGVVDVCVTDCTAYSTALDGGEYARAAKREDCVRRCRQPDTEFMKCVRSGAPACDAP